MRKDPDKSSLNNRKLGSHLCPNISPVMFSRCLPYNTILLVPWSKTYILRLLFLDFIIFLIRKGEQAATNWNVTRSIRVGIIWGNWIWTERYFMNLQLTEWVYRTWTEFFQLEIDFFPETVRGPKMSKLHALKPKTAEREYSPFLKWWPTITCKCVSFNDNWLYHY